MASCWWLTGLFTFSLNSDEMPILVMWYFEMIQCVMSRSTDCQQNLKWIMKYSNLIWGIWSKSRINSIETFSINFLLCIHLEKCRDLILITMQSLKSNLILSKNGRYFFKSTIQFIVAKPFDDSRLLVCLCSVTGAGSLGTRWNSLVGKLFTC